MPSERNGDGGPARRIWLRNSAAAAGAGPGRGAGKRRLAQRGVWDSVTPAKATGGLRVASLHFIALLTLAAFGDGAAALEVLLRAPNYVFMGDSAVLKCEHGVSTAQLHKVEWLKDGDHKLFQFVRGRNPPFRNFTTPGATLDWSRSNENEIRLTGLSLEANGVYSCEVSMETPIYTKPSNDERLVVIQRQSEDPVVRGVKESYFAGEKVAVNCTSSPTHPPVQIAWLVNGREVSDQLLTRFSDGSTRHYKLTTHHNRPFRTSSDDHLEDVYNYGSPESPKGKSANALGTMDNRLQGEKTQGSGKSDFLASAALGKLLHGNSPRTTTTRPASLRPGQGGLIVAAPTGASASQTLGARATVLTTDAASAASVATAGTPPADGDEDDEESNPMDVFDPPEVASILTASLSTTTVQLSFVLTDEVVRYLKKDSEESGDLDVDPTIPKVRLLLTCSAIIPETVDGRYADERRTTIAADVILSEETTARFSSASHSTHSPPRPWLLFLPLLASLFLLAATTQPAALHSQETATTLSLTMMREDSSLPQLPVFTCKACSANHVRPRR